MNGLSQLVKINTRKKKRIARGLGSGKGAKSGRGTTRHQRARENIPIHFEGGQNRMVKKFPLLRGKGKNKSPSPKAIPIALDMLNAFAHSDVVDRKALLEKGMIDEADMDKMRTVKIVKKGKIEKKLTVRLPVTKGAAEQIIRKGGKIE